MDRKVVKQVLFAAWASVLLGLCIQGLLVLVALGFGQSLSWPKLLADGARTLSWSMLVCVGTSIGLAALRLRAPIMGLLGLMFGPIGFNVAKTVHKSASQALGMQAETISNAIVIQFTIVRAAEYLLLGLVIGYISRQKWGGFKAHLLAGLFAGLLFGAVMIGLLYSNATKPVPTAMVVSRAVNEVLFPIGCSIVLFGANALGKRLSERSPGPSGESAAVRVPATDE